MKRLSIKARVTLLCTLLAAVIAAAALIWMLLGEQRALEDYYRSTLFSTAQLAKDQIFYEDGELNIDRNLDDLPQVQVSLFTSGGNLVYGRVRFEKEFVHGAVQSVEGWMAYDEKLTFENGDPLWLRCYISDSVETSVRGGQRSLMLMILPAMVLLGGFGGFGIAYRAFKPVSRIVRTAEGIAGGEDLKKRIGFEGTKDELYTLAATFDEMFARLDAAFERERRFTSDASHELRTPVAGILAQSEFALSDAATDADRREAIGEIHRRASDMSALIARLLTLSRMDAKRIPVEYENVELGLAAHIAAETISETANAKGMTIIVTGEATVRADQMMVAQAALNLAENAVRYGKTGGTVEIRAEETQKDARLSVTDDGPGIAPESLPHLFERFWQAEPSHGGAGSGLGLPLAERIMALHGGRVEVESEVGKGSRFTLVFPKEE